jgi:glucose/arabinose dehydrogenase
MNNVTEKFFSMLRKSLFLRSAHFVFFLLVFFPHPAAQANDFSLKRVVSGFVSPVDIGVARGEVGRFYVLEENGSVILVENGVIAAGEPFFTYKKDENKLVQRSMRQIAFHPKYFTNGKFYLSFSRRDGFGTSLVVTELSVEQGETRALPENQRPILSMKIGDEGAVGGALAFDETGMLLVGISDRGTGKNKGSLAQSKGSLLGSLIRIDVSKGETYEVPKDNPLLNSGDALGEIYAYGFKNPRTIVLGEVSKKLWLGDSGLDAFEEINVIEAGGNFGWDSYEGNMCLLMRFQCQNSRFISPYFSYPHKSGRTLVVGPEYSGKSLALAKGDLLFADGESGKIFALNVESKKASLLLDSEAKISSIVADSDGEILIADYKSGKIFRLQSGTSEEKK